MATGTNGIATESEAKSKLGYSGSVDTNKCCTESRAITMGADRTKLTSYKYNQLVKYSDILLGGPSIKIESNIDQYYSAKIFFSYCVESEVSLSSGVNTVYIHPSGGGSPSVSAILIFYESTNISAYPYLVRWNSSYSNYISGSLPSSPLLWTGASGWLNSNSFSIHRI